MLLVSRRLPGKLFQAAAAECLNTRDVKTNLVLDFHSKCLADERSVRTGS